MIAELALLGCNASSVRGFVVVDEHVLSVDLHP
jgi:hypothetical protein